MKSTPKPSARPAPQDDDTPPPMSKRLAYFTIFGLIVLFIVIVSVVFLVGDVFGRLNANPRREPKIVASDATLSAFVSTSQERAFPMGFAAASGGSYYLSLMGTGAVLKVAADGKTSTFAQLTAPGALAVGPDDAVYVIDYRGADARTSGYLKRISPNGGQIDLYGGPVINDGKLPLFSSLAFDKSGTLYVTHPDTGQIWRIPREGTPGLWWTLPDVGTAKAKPTGIAYDAQRDALLIIDAESNAIYRVDMSSASLSAVMIYRQPEGTVYSAVTDARGRLLVAAWINDIGTLTRIDSDGTTALRIAENFRAPLSLVYRDNRVYVVNSDAPGLTGRINTAPPYTVDVIDLTGLAD